MVKEKSKTVAYLLLIFFGAFGAHKFYLGKTGSGLLYLFTLGCAGICVLIDLFTLGQQVDMVNMQLRTAQSAPLPQQNITVHVAGNTAPTSSDVDVTKEIEKYAKLLEQGHITQEEFEEKKKELLSIRKY